MSTPFRRAVPGIVAAPPPTGLLIGWNFRATENYRNDDGLIDVFSDHQTPLGTTHTNGNGVSIDAGFHTQPDFSNDKSLIVDVRLAGNLAFGSSSMGVWEIECPPGTYRAWCALGTTDFGGRNVINVYDGLIGSQGVGVIVHTQDIVTPAGQFAHIIGSPQMPADWVLSYDTSYTTIVIPDRGAGTGMTFYMTTAGASFFLGTHIRVEEQ